MVHDNQTGRQMIERKSLARQTDRTEDTLRKVGKCMNVVNWEYMNRENWDSSATVTVSEKVPVGYRELRAMNR